VPVPDAQPQDRWAEQRDVVEMDDVKAAARHDALQGAALQQR
jgi:hypothetical protein